MTLTSILRNVSKRTWAAAAIVTAVVVVPAGLMAWGPNRPTYTMANPADHVTFNSITDATNYGDERNFVTISQDGTNWTDDVTVANGQEYYVRIYVHNNAASNLNLVAQNVMARLNVPTQTANRIQVDGYVDSSNANPNSVWDQAVFHGANNANFKLNYVAGSASYHNGKGQFALGDSIVSSGAKLGYDKMDGNIPGCFEYSGAVFLKVKAQTSDFNISKTVRKAGSGSFSENVAVKPSDKVDFQLYFKNTGGVNQTTVSMKDVLPAGLSYVPGSTFVHDDKGTRNVADGITAGGMTMGSYLPNGDVYVKFTAKVADNDKLAVCGTNNLVNTMSTTTAENGTKTDTASVTVTKECQPEKVKACNLKTLQIETVEKSKIDNVNYTTDLSKCEKKPEMVKACNLKTFQIETVDKSKIDNVNYTTDLSKCEKKPETVKACDLKTKKIVTVEKSKIDNVNYTTDLSKCEEEKTVKVCDLTTKQIVTVKESDASSDRYTTDLSKCATTPTTPTELPHTGASDGILSILGLGSIVGVATAYIASRRAGQN